MQDQGFVLEWFNIKEYRAEQLSPIIILWIMEQLATDVQNAINSQDRSPLQVLHDTDIGTETIIFRKNSDPSIQDRIFFQETRKHHSLLNPNLLSQKMDALEIVLSTLLRDWFEIKYGEDLQGIINTNNIFEHAAVFLEINTPWRNEFEKPIDILKKAFLGLENCINSSTNELREFSIAISTFIEQIDKAKSIFKQQDNLEKIERAVNEAFENLTQEEREQLDYGIGKMLLGKDIKRMRKDQIKTHINAQKTEIRNIFYCVNYHFNSLETLIPSQVSKTFTRTMLIDCFDDFENNQQHLLYFEDPKAPSGVFGSVFTAAPLKIYSSDETVKIYLPRLPIKKNQKIALKKQLNNLGSYFKQFINEEADALQAIGELAFKQKFMDTNTAYIPMKYAGSQNMLERLKSEELTHPNIQFPVLFHLAEELKKIHENDITHQDLKPANIMLSKKGTCKIIDFGLSMKDIKAPKQQANYQYKGYTPFYAIDNVKNEAFSGFRKDIFALGIVFLTVLFNKEFIQMYHPTEIDDFENGLPRYLLGDRIVNNTINWKTKPILPRDINLDDYPAEIKVILDFIYETMLDLSPSQNDAEDSKIITQVFELIKKQYLLYTLKMIVNLVTENKETEVLKTLDNLKMRINPKCSLSASDWFTSEIQRLSRENQLNESDFILFEAWEKRGEPSGKPPQETTHLVKDITRTINRDKKKYKVFNVNSPENIEIQPLLQSVSPNSTDECTLDNCLKNNKYTAGYFKENDNALTELLEELTRQKSFDEVAFFRKNSNQDKTENNPKPKVPSFGSNH